MLLFTVSMGGGGLFFLFAVWAGASVFLLLGGPRRARFLFCLGEGLVATGLPGRGGGVCFAVRAGDVFFVLLGRGRGFTQLPACLGCAWEAQR